LSGNFDQDRKLIRLLLEESSKSRKPVERRLEAGEPDAFNQHEEGGAGEPLDMSDKSDRPAAGESAARPEAGRVSERTANRTSKADRGRSARDTAATRPPRKLAALRDHVLSIVAGRAPALMVPEVAAALLLARAIEQDKNGLERLLSIVKSRKSIVAVQVPVRDFERHFGHLLEDGLVMPFYVSLETIAEGPSLAGRYKPLADSKRRKSFNCFSGALLKRYSDDDELRTIVSKRVLTAFKPLIICDELDRPLPARLVSVADMVITGDGIDANLIADVLAICQNIEAENRENAKAKEEEDREDGFGALTRRSETRKREKYSGCFDIIDPVKETDEHSPVNGQTAKQPLKPTSGKNHLFVEGLAGYGDARRWALDLKTDLKSFKDKEVAWSDLSTRLLLSGPPGTGKTTFARALCNTLRVPLVATSVARWLETSHLGDVLAAMNATFEQAKESAPCILFIDEVDNIGNRGSSDRAYDDYWSSLVNRMLELLDGASKTEGVIVIGATNRPDKIDPALLRSGRLEKHIVIPPPDTAALVSIIAHHLGNDIANVLESREVGWPGGRNSRAEALTELGNTTTADNDKNQPCDSKVGVLFNG
jgi:hypothetical protein